MRGLTVRHGGGDASLRYRLTASAREHDRFERNVDFKDIADNGQYFEASKTYFVNGRMDWQLTPDSDVMAQFGVSQGDWQSGRSLVDQSDARRLLEPQRAGFGRTLRAAGLPQGRIHPTRVEGPGLLRPQPF